MAPTPGTRLEVCEVNAQPAGVGTCQTDFAVHDHEGTDSTVARPLTYRPDIDGLRALAVLLVVAFHAFPEELPGGFVGVDVFFVISGYLITGLVAAEIKAGSFSVLGFYARRIRRIFPTLLVVLAAAALLGWMLLLPEELAQLGRHIAANTVFASNWVLWGEDGYFDAPSTEKPLLHLWSLAIEEQFYLLWPVILLLLFRVRRGLLQAVFLLLLMSLLASVALTTSDPVAAFYSPLSRAFELLLGGLCAMSRVHVRSAAAATVAALLGVALMVGSAIGFTDTVPFPGWAALFPCVGAALVIVAGPGAISNRLVLAQPAVVLVGLISYPLYLWHWPLLSFAEIHDGKPPDAPIRVGLVLLSVVLAWLTWRFVERPIRSRRSVTAIPVLVVAFGVIGAAGLTLDWAEGAMFRFPPEIQQVIRTERYEYASDARVGTCWLGDIPPISFASECASGPGERPPDLLIWGDSHAGRLYPGIRRLFGAEVGVGQLTRDECPPVLGVGSSNCVASNAAVLATLRAQLPRELLLFGYWDFYVRDSKAAQKLFPAVARTITDLRAAGLRSIIVVGPAPHWREGLPRRVYRQWSSNFPLRRIPERLASGYDPATSDLDRALRAAVEASGGAYVSLMDILCNAEGCLTSVPGLPGTLLTWDYGHLTTAGAELIARRMQGMGLLDVGGPSAGR